MYVLCRSASYLQQNDRKPHSGVNEADESEAKATGYRRGVGISPLCDVDFIFLNGVSKS